MTKKAVIIVISILLVALAVTGIAFAAWSVMEDDGVFTFSASSLELDISSEKIDMDSHALEPTKPITARFRVRVEGEKSTIRFTQSVIKYNGGADGAMIDMPSRIISLTLPNTIYGIGGGDNAETADCEVILAFSQTSMDPHFMNRKISFTITATAEKFVEPVAHNITYVDGGEHTNPTQYTAATNHVLTDPTPRDDGYEFGGWYTDQEFTNRITEIKQVNTVEQESALTDITLYAQWIIAEYEITYMVGDSADDALKGTYTIADAVTLPLSPTSVADGYEFAGWYDNAELSGDAVTAIEVGSKGDRTYYAKIVAIDYTIAYMDGENAIEGLEPSTYTVESGATLAGSAVKEGFTFAGWYDNAELSGEAVTAIEVGSFGNITYYAKWTPNV